MQAVTASERRTPWWQSQALKRNLVGYLFISPFIIGFLVWTVGPMGAALWMSFTDWDLIKAPTFTGLENVRFLLQDKMLLQALKVTCYYTFAEVPLRLVLALVVALLMNARLRGMSFFRTIYYMPSIVPAVANAVMWAWILNTEFGLLNTMLRSIGLPKIKWLQDPDLVIPALLIMSLWGLGNTMVIYLAGLQGIPEVYYEAAEIDGANWWSKFWKITVPQISSVIFFNLVMSVIATFQTFVAGYLITDGGPQNATLFYVLYLYRNGFQYFRMGYAALLGWVLFLIITAMTLVIFRSLNRHVYYEEGGGEG